MERKSRTWHWVLAALLGVVLAATCTVTYWLWYFSSVFQIVVKSTDSGAIVTSVGSGWDGLSSAAIPAVVVTALVAGTCALITRFGGRRLGLVVACLPALAFVLQMGATWWTLRYDVAPGEDYLGVKPAALLAATLIMLMPAVVGAIVVRVGTRDVSLPSD